MYKKFFGFKERPFQLVPNPAYLYLSKSHEEALAHLNYALSEGDGFVEITGEVGTGKTTLCRVFLGNIGENTEVAYIFNPMMTPLELLRTIHDEFGIDEDSESLKDLVDALNRFLIEKKQTGKRVILLIDEAQNLGRDVLEQLRLLSNLETSASKLIQIILVGQPELRDKLDSHELRQLGQRISLSCRLLPLDYTETRDYIQHRIRIASQKKGPVFSRWAMKAIYQYSRGIPRLINIACDRALLASYGMNQRNISGSAARTAIRELVTRGEIRKQSITESRTGSYALLALCLILFLGILYFNASTGLKPQTLNSLPTEGKPPQSAADSAVRLTEPGKEDLLKEEKPDLVSDPENALETQESSAPETAPISKPEEPLAVRETAGQLPRTETGEFSTAHSPDKVPETGEGSAAAKESGGETAQIFMNEPPDADGPLKTPESVFQPEPAEEAPPVPVLKEVRDPATFLNAQDPFSSRQAAVKTVINLWQPYAMVREYLGSLKNHEEFFSLVARQNAFSIQRIDGNFDLIQKLNLPSVLEAQTHEKAAPVYLALTGIRDGKAVLQVGNETFFMSAAELKAIWSGTAYILWKNFFGLSGIIPRNAPEDSILTLKMLLQDVGFTDIPINTDYDSATREAVKTVQARHGIEADGAVGPLTKVILYNEVSSLEIPHLAP
jgi:general secretion pathway protein A